jgi:hypothetical protein
MAFAADVVVTPVHVWQDLNLDDQRIDNEAACLQLLEAAAAALGGEDDQEIIKGAPAAGAPAPAPAGGRVPRNAALARGQLGGLGIAVTNILPPPPPARGRIPTGGEILQAISLAKAALEAASRPGPCGLLMHTNLVAVLRLPAMAGGPPQIGAVEQLIGSSEIEGTSALDGMYARNANAALLFRLEPAAIDLVQTMNPGINVLARNAGVTTFRIEEEIVLRVTDPAGVHLLAY